MFRAEIYPRPVNFTPIYSVRSVTFAMSAFFLSLGLVIELHSQFMSAAPDAEAPDVVQLQPEVDDQLYLGDASEASQENGLACLPSEPKEPIIKSEGLGKKQDMLRPGRWKTSRSLGGSVLWIWTRGSPRAKTTVDVSTIPALSQTKPGLMPEKRVGAQACSTLDRLTPSSSVQLSPELGLNITKQASPGTRTVWKEPKKGSPGPASA